MRLLFITLSILISMSGSLLLAQNQNEEDIFFPLGYEKLLEEAKKQNAPYLLYFYKDGCSSCLKMDSMTFRNKWVKTYLDKRYIADKQKAYSLYSDFLVKKYNVTSFPQVLVFTPEGKIVHRITKYMGPKEFIATLKKFERAHGAAEEDVLSESKEDYDPELSKELKENAKVSGLFRFSIKSEEAEANTLALQIGVFEDYKNLVKTVLELDKNWHENILVSFNEVNGKTVFRLMFGPFYSWEHASSYQRNLWEKMGLKAILIDLQTYERIDDSQSDKYKVSKFGGLKE